MILPSKQRINHITFPIHVYGERDYGFYIRVVRVAVKVKNVGRQRFPGLRFDASFQFSDAGGVQGE